MQVGATAAVLIKSAAAELKRQQEEADETDSLQPASALMGAHPSSAPADVTTISLMAGLGKHAGEEKTPGGGPRGSGMLSQDSGFLDMGGAVRGRSQSIAEPERHFRQKSGTERWRGGIPGVGGLDREKRGGEPAVAEERGGRRQKQSFRLRPVVLGGSGSDDEQSVS